MTRRKPKWKGLCRSGRTQSATPNVSNMPRPDARETALRERGLRPLLWPTAIDVLLRCGVTLEKHTGLSISSKGGHPPTHMIPGQSWARELWGPAWAVLLAEADLNDNAKEWVLTRALKDPDMLASIDTILRLAGAGATKSALQDSLAAFALGVWTPEEEP